MTAPAAVPLGGHRARRALRSRAAAAVRAAVSAYFRLGRTLAWTLALLAVPAGIRRYVALHGREPFVEAAASAALTACGLLIAAVIIEFTTRRRFGTKLSRYIAPRMTTTSAGNPLEMLGGIVPAEPPPPSPSSLPAVGTPNEGPTPLDVDRDIDSPE